MRIIGGRLGGRVLAGPTTNLIRPTSDRLRETIFNILDHTYGGVEGMRVIDLFAGTGALALEALSRGARFALLVDNSGAARAAIRSNVETLGLGGVTRIFRRDARKLGSAPAGERFDLAFLDPPYGAGLVDAALASLNEGGWIAPGAIAVVEESTGINVSPPDAFALLDKRTFGDTQIRVLRYRPDQTPAP